MVRGHTCKVEAAKADKARQKFEDMIIQLLKAYKKGEEGHEINQHFFKHNNNSYSMAPKTC